MQQYQNMLHKCNRSKWHKLATVTAILLMISACQSPSNLSVSEEPSHLQSNTDHFIVGGYGTTEESGIYLISYDKKAKHLNKKHMLAPAFNASYLTWLPKQKRLYSIATTENKSPLLLQYNWNTGQQSFDLLESVNIEGRGICHINTNHDQSKIAVANYTSGDIAVFDSTDTKTVALGQFKNTGKSITSRQQSPHLHYVGWSNDNKYLYATDLGTDEILVFNSKVRSFSRPIHRVKLDAGDGPRHLAFHPQQNFIYSLNELSNSISVYQQNTETGNLELVHKQLLNPQERDGVNNIASAIRIDENGKHLYVAVRGENMLYALRVEKKGTLSLINKVSSGGNHPRDFNFSPSQDYLLVANQNSNNITLIERELDSGKLTETETSVSMIKPSYVSAFGNEFVSETKK